MVQSKKVISLIAVSLFCAANGWAQGRWTRVEGEGLTVLTDGGGGAARQMAERAAQMRLLLGAPAGMLPLRIVLVNAERLFAGLRPSATVGGFYQSSADQDWIVVRWGQPDSERAMSHELVHAYMEHAGPRRPLWLEEGLAEFYSTASLAGGQWTIGEPIASHVRRLNEGAWLGEREFFEARPDSALREENRRIGVFYAQSWAVVHYLLTNPAVREKAPEFFSLLGDGVALGTASQTALGLRPGLLLEAARRAVEQGPFRTARVAAREAAVAPGPVEQLEGEAVGEWLVSLALAAGHPELAKRWTATPAQRGMLALAEGKRDEAERLFGEAITAKDPSPAPYFELALLVREAGRQPERVAGLLRETIRRNPNHAEAHFLLGLQAAVAGDWETAVEAYQRAAAILPRQASFWHTLALALERAGRLGEASHAAMRCRQAARNGAEREMAAGIERLVREPKAAARESKPAEFVPESWRGLRGDATAEGTLVEFDCGARPPLALVDTAREKLTLNVRRGDQIRITGTGDMKHTLACGGQKVKVRVEYIRRTNELTAIEFQ